MSPPDLTIALAGNPNSGKTTVFNAITGARQKVGNYPGVTVEKKEGTARHKGAKLRVVDLPGTYSLTAYSIEEIIARNVVMDEHVDVVIDIVDSSNLERNLYLAMQFVELGAPLVLAFNMSDVAKARGYTIDTERLSALLGVPIIPTVGRKSQGIAELVDAAVAVARDAPNAVANQRVPRYGTEIEPHVRELARQVSRCCDDPRRARWFALKLLEGDTQAAGRLKQTCGDQADALRAEARRLRKHIERVCGDSVEIVLADRRYGYISGACTEAVTQSVERRHERSDRIDAVITNRWLGLPIFAVLMFVMFQLTFSLGNPLVDQLDVWKTAAADAARTHLAGVGGGDLLQSLVADGLIEGVGAVLTFVPLVVLLFLAIAFLEDTGYMARAAFVMDELMHKIGLHGKSFIPMLIGFGCTVPGIMATRVLENRRDRLTTILVLPLISCGARLPIYLLILGAFFPEHTLLGLFSRAVVEPDGTIGQTYLIRITNQALLLFAIYVIGIVLAIVAAKVLRASVLRGKAAPFVMELPPYRMPTVKGLLIHMWERTWMYIRKAGTIILAIVIVLWALGTWPRLTGTQLQPFEDRRAAVNARIGADGARPQERLAQIDREQRRCALERSALGRVGKGLAPVLRPCGFDWKISTALLGAFAAKEVFVGQMGIIYAVGDADEQSTTLKQRLAADYAPLVGFCIMLFCLISSPCMATVAVTVRESGSWRWAVFQWLYLTVLAWVLTTIVYQAGSAVGLGGGA